MRVLVVEPNEETASAIDLMLTAEGMKVVVTAEGEDAIDLAKLYDYDIVVTELDLPDVTGCAVVRALRAGKVRTPILVLSATCGIIDRCRLLNLGADDFMPKPFHRDELVARIHAVVRRSRGHAQSVIATGDLVVHLENRTVSLNDRKIHLTAREYQMLELLALRKGKVLTKEMFLDHLYGGRDEPDLKIIDVFVCKVRRKLAEFSAGANYIETVWGRGYVLRDPGAPIEQAA